MACASFGNIWEIWHLATRRKQQDVVIKRQYQREKVLINAINSGINAGTFFNDAAWGINSGAQSINHQEATGEACRLVLKIIVQKRLHMQKEHCYGGI